jgi:ATP-dependent helicase HrpB
VAGAAKEAAAPALPIEASLPRLVAALRHAGRAVLEAPPGAGKTTRVPLALLEAGLVPGRILMLEPRRVAARAAAERLAATLGEAPGGRVGYRIRGESRPGSAIEVVTEGVLTRMLQSDPALEGIGAVIFDEIHERALQADLGLALALEVRSALRPDLIILAMSATLDAAPLATLMGGAPIVTAEGRTFPVETVHLDRPLGPGAALEPAAADLILRALGETEGGLLAFLPGAREIRRTAALLAARLPAGVALQPLHGAMPFAEQRAALAPLPTARKLVLATSIAETSLTIPDVRVVVDAGRARRARFDPGSGMTRLVTERVTRAEAEQRRGRAGRVAPGLCYRLWTRGEEGALAPYPPPEIATADLAGLALELALWGAEPEALPFLTPPPATALAEARALLRALGALDAATGGRQGMAARWRDCRSIPVSAICSWSRRARAACDAAADARGAARGARAAAGRRRRPRPASRRAAQPRQKAGVSSRRSARRCAGRRSGSPMAAVDGPPCAARRAGGCSEAPSPGRLLSLAYPDRIARRRPGTAPRFLLSGGKGARLAEDDSARGAVASRSRSRRRPARGADPKRAGRQRERDPRAARHGWSCAERGMVAPGPGGPGAGTAHARCRRARGAPMAGGACRKRSPRPCSTASASSGSTRCPGPLRRGGCRPGSSGCAPAASNVAGER